MTSGRPPTIKDVAALAGVSWKTVTNVVHERANVAPATPERLAGFYAFVASDDADYMTGAIVVADGGITV